MKKTIKLQCLTSLIGLIGGIIVLISRYFIIEKCPDLSNLYSVVEFSLSVGVLSILIAFLMMFILPLATYFHEHRIQCLATFSLRMSICAFFVGSLLKFVLMANSLVLIVVNGMAISDIQHEGYTCGGFMYPNIFYMFIIIGSILQFFFWICFACCIGDHHGQTPQQNANQTLELNIVNIVKDEPPAYEEAIHCPKPTESGLPRY